MSRKLWAGLTLLAAVGIILGTLSGLGLIPGFGSWRLPKGARGLVLRWSPDGTSLLLVYGQGRKRIFELRSFPHGKRRWRVENPSKEEIYSVSFQRDRVIIGEEGKIRFLDAGTGKEVELWPIEGIPFQFRPLSDGGWMFLMFAYEDVNDGGVLYLVRTSPDGKVVSRDKIAPYRLMSSRASLSPDGRFLAYTGGEADLWIGPYVVNLRDLSSGQERSWNLKEFISGNITNIALRPDGQEIAISVMPKKLGYPFLFRLNVSSGALMEIPPPDIFPELLYGTMPFRSYFAYSPNGRFLAISVRCVGHDEGVGAFLVEDDRTRTLWEGFTSDFAFSPDGKWLAVAEAQRVFASIESRRLRFFRIG